MASAAARVELVVDTPHRVMCLPQLQCWMAETCSAQQEGCGADVRLAAVLVTTRSSGGVVQWPLSPCTHTVWLWRAGYSSACRVAVAGSRTTTTTPPRFAFVAQQQQAVSFQPFTACHAASAAVHRWPRRYVACHCFHPVSCSLRHSPFQCAARLRLDYHAASDTA